MVRIVAVPLAVLVLTSLAACSSGRRARAPSAARAAAGPMPTSIAYTRGSRGNWTTQPSAGYAGAPYQAATYQQPRAPSAPAAQRYVPTAPAAPAPDYSNVAPYPQPPSSPSFESAPSLLTPTPGPSVGAADWTTPSAPLPSSDWAAPVPTPPLR